MAHTQLFKQNGAVRLREQNNFGAENKADRASKVTSMIELFSDRKKDEFMPPKTNQIARNWTVLNHKPPQEVIQRRTDAGTPNKLVRRPSPTAVSIGLRVPKPYVSHSNKEKEADNTSKGTSPSTAKASTDDSTSSSTGKDNKRPVPRARSKLDSKMNKNAVVGTAESFGRRSPAPFNSGDSKSAQESGPGAPKSAPIGRNPKKVTRKVSWQSDNDTTVPAHGTGRKSPNFSTSNGAVKTLETDSKFSKSDERKVSGARNYWEHKIEPRKELPPKGSTTQKLDADLSVGKQNPSPKPWLNQSTGSSSDSRPISPKLRSTTFEESLENSRSIVTNRVKNFGQAPALKPTLKIVESDSEIGTSGNPNFSKFSPKRDFARATVKPSPPDKHQKPVIPMRPRFMTSAAGLRPKPYQLEGPKKIPSSLHAVSNTKSLAANFEKRPVSPLAKTPPSSPLSKTMLETPSSGQKIPPSTPEKPVLGRIPPKLPEKPDRSPPQNNPPERPEKPKTQRLNDGNNNVVNPIPKPQRTFTFTPSDMQPVKQRQTHRNVIRVSSDLTTINGPGIKENLATILSEELRRSTPNVSTRKPKEGYEEVVFCSVVGDRTSDRSATYQHPRSNTQRWEKHHNYEEVEHSTVSDERKSLTANYDHISLDRTNPSPPPRPASLLDLSSGYSHLTFEQDLHTSAQSKQLSSTSPLQHMKLRQQNSDMSDVISRTSSISKSERSMESGNMLKITDKIREAFTQISRKYKHHNRRKTPDDSEDSKSLSSSGDEDSDTETDIVKHRQTLDRVRTLQKTYRNTLKYKSLERELSRFEDVTIFEQVLICKIVKDQDGKFSSKVSYRFPAPPPGKNVGDEKTLAHFCFPDIDVMEPCEDMPSQSYSFMLTRENGLRKFGYCRRILPPGTGPRYPVVYCLISPLGSFGLYELILDELEQRHRMSLKRVSVFLEALFVERFPAPGRSVTVEIDEPDGSSHFVLRRPFDTRLEHVHLQCLLFEVGVENTIKIFASLLLERRVILCGKSLGTLTACIHALRTLLYPFVWQHVFVPVLPPPMVDLCCSPTPLLIGILETSVEKLKTLPLEEVLILNLSTQEIIRSMGDEMDILPRKLQTPLINSLANFANKGCGTVGQPSYDFAIDYESAERNTVISEAFMHLFVEMIGHYQQHLQPVMQATNASSNRFGKIQRNFNRESFYDDVTSRSLRRFLDLFLETQMFDGFIHSRELSNPDYEGLFERRIAHHIRNADASQLNFKVIKTKMKKLMLGMGIKK